MEPENMEAVQAEQMVVVVAAVDVRTLSPVAMVDRLNQLIQWVLVVVEEEML